MFWPEGKPGGAEFHLDNEEHPAFEESKLFSGFRHVGFSRVFRVSGCQGVRVFGFGVSKVTMV